ncbi:MT-A70-domain-containing protein [Exophiala viscosa]|nr:MT-A70-domain-containing protein [Exophiala viscosa]
MPYPVLYENGSRTIVLLDIPSSIEHGQSTSHYLKSCPALKSSYPSTEPKGIKRDAAIDKIPISERRYHASLQHQISSALTEINEHLSGRGGLWCRKRGALLPQQDGHNGVLSDHNAPRHTAPTYPTVCTDHLSTASIVPLILSTTEPRNNLPSQNNIHAIVVHNPRLHRAIIDTIDRGAFYVPPRATFIRSSLKLGQQAFLACQKHKLLDTRFDLILMDPPWSNRSVRHSGAYQTSEDQIVDPFQQAVDIVRTSLAPNGLVAVWVTNKASIQSTVHGTFHFLEYHLFEEWIWIKTTVHGVPVSPLDGIWRRPYEVLLLFREGPTSQPPRRRVIAAVPDLHSRKPCLKLLLEDLLPSNYNGLELFARNLTSGWWSWGDEVLKFQHESQWTA